MPAKQPHYSPKQVAQSLQVSESSIKRWCDRGVIPTIRTVGGHRRITLDGLQQFLRSTDHQLAQPDILGLPPLARRRTHVVPGSGQPDQKQFREALASGDEAICRKIIRSRLSDGWLRSEAAEDLITDAMHGIGRAWDCNQIDIYQERIACTICMRLINELRADLPTIATDAPIAIGGAPSGDPYDLASALVELALRESGWNASNLGCNLPMDSFVQAAHDQNADLVWLSVSVIDNASLFVAAQNHLANSLGDDVALIVGGCALSDEVRPKLLYTSHCDSLRHLVEFATMLRVKRGKS